MPKIGGIRIPANLYVVLKEPALLAGMSLPGKSTPWEKIGDAGFSNVVCLSHLKVYYNPYPLNVLSLQNWKTSITALIRKILKKRSGLSGRQLI